MRRREQDGGAPLAVIDCFGILSDDAIRRYFDALVTAEDVAHGRMPHHVLRRLLLGIRQQRSPVVYRRGNQNEAQREMRIFEPV